MSTRKETELGGKIVEQGVEAESAGKLRIYALNGYEYVVEEIVSAETGIRLYHVFQAMGGEEMERLLSELLGE